MAKRPGRADHTRFVFRKHANIGAADATDDSNFLSASFVDNGELAILADTYRPECIVVGRTGSGKTALLERLASDEESVIKIAPEGLALTYISDSGVLGFFTTAGVNMDLFYKLLWRHVLAVEIIREHYHIVNEQGRDDFVTKIKDRLLQNRARRDALNYLIKWGESFWKDSEYRVKEVTKTLEQELGGSLTGAFSVSGIADGKLSADSARKLKEEEKAEVVLRGQAVVDKVQIKTLSDIIDLLKTDILNDRQKKYYIAIDRLDENWVNDDLRYRLIKALLDTIRDFNSKIRMVKVVAAIREDLLDRVFRYTRSAGHQEEKYRSLYLCLGWRENELEQLLDLRVGQLVKEQFTTKPVRLRDLLPASISKEDPVKYILERTMLRPRDAIMFLNECIRAAEGKAKITQTMVLNAEANYSDSRLRALADEWTVDYTNLIELSRFLK